METCVVSLFNALKIDILSTSNATLTCYIANNNTESPTVNRNAILIVPGGGQDYCSKREGEPVALHFLSKGFNAFVLEYSTRSTSDARFPTQLLEAMAAIYYIKENASKHHGNPSKVHALGFSAGGHLAASLAFLGNKVKFKNLLGINNDYDLSLASLLLGYPVISNRVDTHMSSFENITTTEFDKDYLSLEQHITESAPPLFIFSTSDDAVVPIANSLVVMQKYALLKKPFEAHVYEKGYHGFSLANELVSPREVVAAIQKNIPTWVEDACDFIKRQ